MIILNLENVLQISLEDNPVIYKRIIRSNDKWNTHVILNDLTIELSNNKVIKIEKGFTFDRSSVPQFLWSILPPETDTLIAYLIHDWFFSYNKLIIHWFAGDSEKARKFADDEMLKWCRAMTKGLSFKYELDNVTRYRGSRLFGRKVWEN